MVFGLFGGRDRLISKKGLKNLDNYAFHGVDHSWLAAHGLNDYWNFCVKQVPLSVAPNLLTLLGFISQLIGFCVMSYYNPDFATKVPAWVYFCCALCLFVYQTLDNIDGKQARRTGSSSPLGELIDHTSDSMGVGCLVATIGAGCTVGPELTLIVFFSVITAFFMAHWEEYFTGELILGQFDGPTESQMFTIMLHCLNGFAVIFDFDIWGRTYFGVSGRVLFSLSFCFLCILSSIKVQLRMWILVHKTGIPFTKALSVGLPFLTFFVSAIAYCVYTPELLQHHRWDESRLLFFVMTAIFGYITSRLIVQRVCKEPAPVMYPIVIPIAVAGFHAVLHRHFGVPHYVDPHLVLKGIAFISGVQVISFFYALNKELTTYLGIKTFSIPLVEEEVGSAPKKTTGKRKSPRRSRKDEAEKEEVKPSKKKGRSKSASPRRRSPRRRSTSAKRK